METDELIELCRLARHGGSLEEVQFLLSAGVDINQKNLGGISPLLLAAYSNRKDLVELLIQSGADIHDCYYGNITVLHFASDRGWKAIAETLVEKGADVNAIDDLGLTPLLTAALNKHTNIIELLVSCGADVNVFHYCRKRTVLHYASYRGWKEIAEALLEKGADVDARDVNGDTPLDLAVFYHEFSVVSVLLKAGGDSNRRNTKGESPFYQLVYRGNMDAIKLAIEMGAYMDLGSYDAAVKRNLLRNTILGDVELCTQLILNEFNRKHLSELYDMFASKLPLMDRLRIGSGSWQALQVKEAVTRDMRRGGPCDVLKTRPLVLSMLCVRQLNNPNHK